ncbi:MAG: winged helix-turn-helix domain-containing protein [Candidatus Acidiferrum sp.]
MPQTEAKQVIRFGTFEVDSRTGELRKNGLQVKLQEQPFQILLALLKKPGEVVTREELRAKLWPTDTFVDFEHGLNAAVKRLRDALGDTAENSRFIETLPRRGYRFIGPTEQPTPIQVSVTFTEDKKEKPSLDANKRRWLAVGLGLAAACVLVALGFHWITYSMRPPRVLGYRQLTADRQIKGLSCGFGAPWLVSDGTRVFFSEPGSSVLQVSSTGGDVVKVSNPFECFFFFDISPDKTELLGGAQKNSSAPDKPIWVLSLASGQARRVGNLTGHAGTWSPDGQKIVYATGDDLTGSNDIYIAAKDGSDTRKLARIENGFVFAIHWSPDGRVLRMGGTYKLACYLWEVSNDGTNPHEVPRAPAGNRSSCWYNWTPDGNYSLLAVPREPSVGADIWVFPEKRSLFHWKPAKPVQLTTGPMSFWEPTISPDGKHIFAVGGQFRGELARYDLKSHRLEPYLSGISADQLDFSRDGKWVAYVTYPENILWRSRVDGSERIQLTTPPLVASVPNWSPSGTRIAFSGILPGGLWKTYVVSAEGGKPEMVSQSQDHELNPTWTPDGNSLIIGGLVHSAQTRVSSIDLRTGRVSVIPGSEGMRAPRISPDGRFIVALESQSDSKFFLFDQQTQKWSVLVSSSPGVAWQEWSSDSKYLYFSNWAETHPRFLYRVRIAGSKLERVAGIEVPEGVTGYWCPWMIAAPDGSPILLRDLGIQEIYAIDVDLP